MDFIIDQKNQMIAIHHGPKTMKLSFRSESPLFSGKFPHPINAELLFKLYENYQELTREELKELSQMQKVYGFPELKAFPNMGEIEYRDFKFLILNDYFPEHLINKDFESFLLKLLDQKDPIALLVLRKAYDRGIRLKPSMVTIEDGTYVTYPPGMYNFKTLNVLKWLIATERLYNQPIFLLERCFAEDLVDCLEYLLENGYLKGISSKKMIKMATEFHAKKCVTFLKK